MADATVERELTFDLLEKGELAVGPIEAERLDLPIYTGDVEITFLGASIHSHWDARSFRLTGEELRDELQLNGERGQAYRLERVADGALLLTLVASRRGSLIERRPTPARGVTSRPAAKPKKRDRRARDRYQIRDRGQFEWSGKVGIHKKTVTQFAKNIDAGGWDPLDKFLLRLKGEEIAAVNDFDELLAIGLAKVDHMPHQEATALRVLAHMYGRAILADEVGLGKTIEAGLIVKELITRGMAQRVLVLCPASLRTQWQSELEEKFDETFEIAWSGRDTLDQDRLIVSLTLAALERHARRLQDQDWDLVIVDEAHKLGKSAKKSRDLVRGLESRYLLFLTATPVENSLLELYRLVDVLRPGTFQSQRDFTTRFLDEGDQRTPKDPAALRRLAADVMVRTTRVQAGVDNVVRHAKDIPVELSDVERRAYDVIVNTLRTAMNEPGDHLRRRQLAHRLTGSPRSLLISARRLAEKHPNPQVRALLSTLADEALDFPPTNRQRKLLELCREWVADGKGRGKGKGKILVFTQHSDTLDDLVRIVSSGGLDAVAYHGGLSPSARSNVLAEFRDSAQIMVSTEAGAEGLNLQFANCVVNFDLPWNPMRIEQRIGRVHRVGQMHDVYVANFFAVDTIDEHVYRILHDKLRMFELLFGQVTTILGELEESFDKSIMDAILQPTDEAMAQQLGALGDAVAEAKAEAESSIQDTGRLNSWAADLTHRDEIDPNGARELMPQVELRQHQREKAAEQFIREYLRLDGAEVVYETTNFLTAALQPKLAEELGTPELHLAFSTQALAEHPDAELCAVGSALFDEFLDAIRDEGDLAARIPVIPATDDGPRIEAAPGLQLIERRVIGPRPGGVESMWRVRDNQAVVGDQVMTTWQGQRDDSWGAVQYRSLDDSEALPPTLPRGKRLLEGVQRAAVPQLAEVADEIQREADRRSGSETERMTGYYEEKIETCERQLRSVWAPERVQELQKELADYTKGFEALQRGAGPQVEVTADLLAVRVDASPTIDLTEIWSDAEGTFELAGVWDLITGTTTYHAADGQPISHLAVCTERHVVDRSRTRSCEQCDELACEYCTERWRFETCALCGREVCGACLPAAMKAGVLGLCPACATPQRSAELDTDHCVAFRLGGDLHLLVGERSTTLIRDDNSPKMVIVPDEDVDDEDRLRARQFAALHDLPVDTEFAWAGDPLEPAPPALLATVEVDRAIDWTIGAGLGSVVDPRAVAHVGNGDGPDVLSEHGSGLKEVIATCRNLVPPPHPPRITVSATADVRATVLCSDGLRESTSRWDSNGQIDALNEEVREFSPADADDRPGTALVTVKGTDATITIRRINHSFVVEAQGALNARLFVPFNDTTTPESEYSWASLADRLGVSGARFWSTDAGRAPSFVPASPSQVTCLNRVERPATIVTRGAGDHPTQAQDLASVGAPLHSASDTTDASSEICGIAIEVAQHHDQPSDLCLKDGIELDETWQGHSQVTLRYLVSDGPPVGDYLDRIHLRTGDPALPRDPDGQPLADFDIDSFGHVQPPGATTECLACERWSCVQCGPEGVLAPCSSCGQSACGRCLASAHEAVPQAACERCHARSCNDCGRDLHASSCVVCGRQTCFRCRTDDTCQTCSSLAPLPTGWVPPIQLHAAGLHLLVSSDAGHDEVLMLAGPQRREIAILRATDGAVSAWRTYATTPCHHQRLALAAVAALGITPADPLVTIQEHGSPATIPDDALTLVDEALTTATLTLRDGSQAEQTLGSIQQTHDSNLDHLVAGLLAAMSWEAPELPVPSATRAPQALTDLSPPADDAHSVLTADIVRVHNAVWIDERGLHLHTPDEALAGSDGSWTMKEPPDWATATWMHHPQVALGASAGGYSAMLLRQGDFVVLVVRGEDQTRWYRLAGQATVVLQAALGEHLIGDGTIIEVTQATLPSQVKGPSILGYTFSNRQVSPQVRESQGLPDSTLLARLVEELVDERVSFPSWQPTEVGSPLRDRLADVARAGLDTDVHRVAIGLEVTEQWLHEGKAAEVSYVLEPGATQASVRCYDTGGLFQELLVDRSGHVVGRWATCTYCSTSTCARCPASTTPCAICGIEICGNCADNVHRCPACQSLTGLGKMKSWQTARSHGWKGRVLHGTDDHHEVAVGRGPAGWRLAVTRDSTDAERPLGDEAVGLLGLAPEPRGE